MNTRVLLNLLNKLRKEIKCEVLPSILSLFAASLIIYIIHGIKWATKPVFGVAEKATFKSVPSATETS